MIYRLLYMYFLSWMLLGVICCSGDGERALIDPTTEEALPETSEGTVEVRQVTTSGTDNQFTFSVTLASTDLGCHQYADWWEVLDFDGNLLYRRILAHSHVNEQPFTRSGGPVAVAENTEVYIRAHMNTTGYGRKAFKGSIANGFAAENLDPAFAKDLETKAPLPARCDF